MNNISKPVLYVVFLIGTGLALFWEGVIPAPLSPSQRIALVWKESFAARHRLSDDGKVVQLTVGSTEFSTADCKQLAEMVDVERLDLSGTSIDDGALKAVTQMNSLRSLRLDGTKITDQGLKSLADSPTLTELSLSRCDLGGLTSDGIGSLAALESLSLMGTPLVDSDIAAIRSLTALRKLYLGDSGLSSSCLKDLRELDNLQLLNLIGLTTDDDSDFVALAELPALEMLYLDRSEISDSAFAAFVTAAESGCQKLQGLFLEGCPISDVSQDALTKLVTLPEFTKLRLTGTQVSRAVFEKIVKASPNVSYAHGAGGMSEDQ